jgi:transposase InsO family protein
MSVKLTAALVAVDEGRGKVNVAAACREAGVSRKTFYKWLARYRAEGLDGLEERSRRPLSSSARIASVVEDRVVRVRKELLDAGLDHGPTTIQWHLGRDPVCDGPAVPSVASIHRILVRRGMVDPRPRKRPKSSIRRFEAPAPNEMWQIDATDWVISTGVVRVFNIIDDHSRVAIRSLVVSEATCANAWQAFSDGATSWGMPARMLSDNGLCFSGKLRGFEVEFEARLRDAGIRPSTGRPFHPQTTGKVERFQQTLKRWLRNQTLAATIEQLQAQLDEFCEIYNHHRPHQGIGRATPASRWHASTAARPAPAPLAHPSFTTSIHNGTVNRSGSVNIHRYSIHLGIEWEGRPAKVHIENTHANVFIDDTLVRHLELDTTRIYQPSGRKRGGPRKPRLPS